MLVELKDRYFGIVYNPQKKKLILAYKLVLTHTYEAGIKLCRHNC